ncbi:NADH:flavin oxidoreductase [Massilia endophytica]|nr:NADH:flavin oxidoreductase [Massilia endophytica]
MEPGILFSPTGIKQLGLRNRLAVAPMTRVSATEDGHATERMARYYRRFAEGGFGLVITEGMYTDQAYSQGYLFQPGISSAEQAESWRPVVDAVHAAGGKIVAQLMHAGALAQGNRFRGHTAGPSAVQPKGEQMKFYRGSGPYPVPREMRQEDIEEAAAGFAHSAQRAMDAGFDGVEIHGANGYLLDQFLTRHTNLREDQWGGNTENRIRLHTLVLGAVREALGHRAPVGIRISQAKVNDFSHKWAGEEDDARIVFSALAAAGADYIHVTEFEAWKPAFGTDGPSLLELARRYAPGVALIANGSLHESCRGAEAIAAGADLVAMGRSALANPGLPALLSGGAALAAFDSGLLSPIADIKDIEIGGQGKETPSR